MYRFNKRRTENPRTPGMNLVVEPIDVFLVLLYNKEITGGKELNNPPVVSRLLAPLDSGITNQRINR